MKNYTKEQKQYLDKIDELLSIRESKKSSLKDTDKMLMQGFALIKSMPIRWYVRNNGQKGFKSVIKYLKKKYKLETLETPEGFGSGELHGEFAFIPDDCQYTWEITQEEFNYLHSALAKNLKYGKGNNNGPA